jgi:hypothetical protein
MQKRNNTNTERLCPSCKTTKPIVDFYVVKGASYPWCKLCCSEKGKERNKLKLGTGKRAVKVKENLQLLQKGVKRCTKCNLEQSLSSFYIVKGKHYSWCKDCVKKGQDARFQENPEKIRQQKRTICNRRYQEAWKFDTNKRLIGTIRSSLNQCLGGKNRVSWTKFVSWNIEELKTHLECLWTSGMSWKNYGKGDGKWCIDHDKPIASFSLPDKIDECWSLDNLKPLWFDQNSSKNSTYNGIRYTYKTP